MAVWMNKRYWFSLVEAVYLPTPRNISYFWNFGSLLGITIGLQVCSGILLTLYYISDSSIVFGVVDYMGREPASGLFIRYSHIVGGSLVFIFFYLHIARGLVFGLYYQVGLWLTGSLMFVMAMAAGFLGYVLPWGQMSYWGATVITNFCSVVPFVGQDFVCWIWGGFSVDGPTLIRFFSLHYLVPLLILFLIIVHFVVLHDSGSSNPLGVTSKSEKLYFYPYFVVKDFVGVFLGLFGVWIVFFWIPELFFEAQNANEANVLVTPPHIQPEWYYLAAYAVLRAVPSKGGGVLSLVLFVGVLFLLPFFYNKSGSLKVYSWFNHSFWIFWFLNFVLLTWLGACVVEYPFVDLARVSAMLYFGLV
uniref:Cytochrome b n=1 Tax=Syndesmis echinorum TaxID=2019369 RepID=A0A7G5XUL8_9PLAT|nr:cytochrome b [Syndesmis echinorum]QNA49653.1 cytochrome b [Syndesmis echinorum]